MKCGYAHNFELFQHSLNYNEGKFLGFAALPSADSYVTPAPLGEEESSISLLCL